MMQSMSKDRPDGYYVLPTRPNATVTTVTEQQDPYAMLPPLPADQLITANADIGWADIMAAGWCVPQAMQSGC